MSQRIRKAVFPVAGLGTRFLPATKTVPKEMLPIVDRPLIQYAVDEAVEAGCDTLIFVTVAFYGVFPIGSLLAGQMLAKVTLSIVLVPPLIVAAVALGRKLDGGTGTARKTV